MYTGLRLMNQAGKPIKSMPKSEKEQGMHSTKKKCQWLIKGVLISIIHNL